MHGTYVSPGMHPSPLPLWFNHNDRQWHYMCLDLAKGLGLDVYDKADRHTFWFACVRYDLMMLAIPFQWFPPSARIKIFQKMVYMAKLRIITNIWNSKESLYGIRKTQQNILCTSRSISLISVNRSRISIGRFSITKWNGRENTHCKITFCYNFQRIWINFASMQIPYIIYITK